MEIQLETFLPWGEPKRVETSAGPRILRKALTTEAFWSVWRTAKAELKAAGISCGQYNGVWEVCWWQPLPKQEQAQLAQAIEASRATDAEILIPAPDGLNYLGYQKAGIAFALARKGTYIGDEMGLGKTIQAIGVINSDPAIKRVLIICPATLKINWKRELVKWLTRRMTVGIAESKEWPLSDVVVINFDVLHKHLSRLQDAWDMVVVDEVHYIKDPASRRARCVIGHVPKKKKTETPEAFTARFERDHIPALFGSRKIVMSGTPICNKPMDLWPVISWLDPVNWSPKGFWKFAQRYCGATQNSFGWDFTGASHLQELQEKLRATCMVRRLKKDVLKELPDILRQIVELPNEGCAGLLKEEWETHRQMEEEVAELEAQVQLSQASDDPAAYEAAIGKLRKAMAVQFTEVAKIAHEVALAKLPRAIEHIRSVMEEGKVLVFAHHIDVVDGLRAAFPGFAVVVGGMSGEQKMAAVDKFQNDPACGGFIGSIHAAGEGLTLTAGSHVIFVELDWVPAKMSQCEARCLVKNSLVLQLHLVNNGGMSISKIQNIKVGDFVLTHHGNAKRVSAVNSHLHDGPITTVRYVGWLEPLQCTPDHKVMVKRGATLEWVQAHQLLPTDSMAFPKIKEWEELEYVKMKPEWRLYHTSKPITCQHSWCLENVEARGLCRVHYRELLKKKARPPKPMQINGRYVRLPDVIEINDDWLYLFGWYAAEGFSSIRQGKPKCISCSGHKRERHVLDKILTTLNKIGVAGNIYSKADDNGIEMRAYSGELAMWFRAWFGHMSENMSLPHEITSLPPHQAAVFLRGYTDGDGYQRDRQVEWVSASQVLCYQICLLAIRAGFIPTMRRGSKASGSHWVGGYTKFGRSGRLSEQDANYIYRPIRSVETSHGRRVRVYDLTVEDDHSFTSGFCTVHNCHRIGQRDSVLVQHLVLDGSLDVRKAEVLIEKQKIIESALDKVSAMREMEEPVTCVNAVRVSREQIEREAKLIPADVVAAIHHGLRMVAGQCNGARNWDDMGFSKFDTALGKGLAGAVTLSQKQAVIGRRLCLKYRRQIEGADAGIMDLIGRAL